MNRAVRATSSDDWVEGLNALLGSGSDEYLGHTPSTIPMHAAQLTASTGVG